MIIKWAALVGKPAKRNARTEATYGAVIL